VGQPARVRGPACGLELRPAGGRAQNSPGAVSEHSRIGIRDTVHSGQRELPPGEVGRTGSAYGLLVDRELVDRELVDRGGISCAGFSCMWSGGTAGYSRRIQTSNAQCKNMLASNGEITAGGVRSCAQRVQDPDRRLQRRRPARLLRARVVRLSRLHVPPQAGTQPVRDLLPELPPGRLWSGGHADAARAAPLAAAPPQRQDPHGPGAHAQPGAPGTDQLHGRFYPSALYPTFRHLNDILVRWAMRKYKRLRRRPAPARRFLAVVARRQPDLFAHWRFGVRPAGWTMGAR